MFRRLAPVLVATLAVVACDSDDRVGDASVPPVPASTVPTGSTVAAESGSTVPAALQFTAPLVGGGSIDLAELGDRPVLLWFWAPW